MWMLVGAGWCWLVLVGAGMVLVWCWYGAGMVLVWCWYGAGMVLVWCWCGASLKFLQEVRLLRDSNPNPSPICARACKQGEHLVTYILIA